MAVSKDKVAGYREGCFYYDPCPICFGCRNYRTYCNSKCEIHCDEDKKNNVCKNEKHNPSNFEKLIMRPKIVINTKEEKDA